MLSDERKPGRQRRRRIGYYKSCSLEGSSKDLAHSLESAFARLNTELVPIRDWSCCGASSAHSTNRLLGLALPARNLALAEQQGLTTLLVPCSACYIRMLTAAEKMRMDDTTAYQINEILEPLQYQGTVQVKNIMEILWNEVGVDEILRAKRSDLNGMRLVCYYGCYLTRTPGLPCFDDPENPQALERLVRVLGGEPINWPYKTDCCGGGFSLIEARYSVQLCEKLYEMAQQVGAEAFVTTCPLCQTNLDLNQDRLRRDHRVSYNMPIFYVTDLICLVTQCELGNEQWRKHFVDPRELLDRYGLV